MKFEYIIRSEQFRNLIFQWRNLRSLRWSCFMTCRNIEKKMTVLHQGLFSSVLSFLLHMHAWKSTNDFKQAILNHYGFLSTLFCKCFWILQIFFFQTFAQCYICNHSRALHPHGQCHQILCYGRSQTIQKRWTKWA